MVAMGMVREGPRDTMKAGDKTLGGLILDRSNRSLSLDPSSEGPIAVFLDLGLRNGS